MRNNDGSPKAGTWCRHVCWLVQYSPLDAQIPDDHSVVWVLLDPVTDYGIRIPRVLHESLDREEITELSKEYYRGHRPHLVVTRWYDARGRRVIKREAIAKAKNES